MNGRVAIVTGAGAGIGAAAARAFADAGATVVLVDISETAVEQRTAALTADGATAIGLVADLGAPAAVDAMVAEVIERYGRIDALYNNAGGPIRGDGDITEIEDSVWEAALRVDLFGTIYCSRAVVGPMKAAGYGRIVNTSSLVAVRGIAGRDAYVAAKGAIMALTRAMAAEFGPHGITVNAVAPGVTRSDRVLVALAEDNRTQALVDRHVLGLVDPEDIAAAAVFLAGESAGKITGQIISVDSGATQILTSQH